jgi:ABC-type Mn2+/Zn2+ transport system permease subunit
MAELLDLNFFRNALIMSALLAVLFGLLSFFTVMRKMSFMGAGISHTAFGGVALGIVMGLDPFPVTLVFCAVSALIIGKLVRHGNISYDAGIGIFFSFAMALGAILISLKKNYTFDLQGYLFGNILGVTFYDNIIAFSILLLFMIFVFLFLHRILFMTFDEEAAWAAGVNVEFLDSMLLVFLASIIVISMKIVGIVLVSALTVLPASFGLLISNDFRRVLIIGIIYSVIIMGGGLFLSYYLDTPAGATMVTLGTMLYFTAVAGKKIMYGKVNA